MRKKILSLFFLSLVGSGTGYFLINSYTYNLCFRDLNTLTFDVSCSAFYERIGDPLFFGFLALSVIFLILLILPQAFRAWKKFAVWFVPLAALLFIFYPDPGSGDYFSPYPEQVFQWVSMVYIGASLGVIGVSLVNDWWKRKRHKPLHAFWYWAGAVPLAYIALTLTQPLLALLPF